MTSQAVYCLSLQIRPPSEENTDGTAILPSTRASSSKTTTNKMQSDIGTVELTTQLNNNNTTQIHQQPHHSNIFLVRGARTENGQIILQNSHELLSLLNDEDKPILLQHQRVKTKNSQEGTILFQPTLKTSNDNSIILQSPVKKNSTSTEGSILFQQRLNKSGTTDGPILLQTLKRLDKSQPILVFRSTSNTTTTATTTSVKTQSGITEDVEERNEPLPQKQANVPLGSDGEPIKLPENLESLPRADHFPIQRHRWNTNEEIAAILISFDKHSEWQSKEVKTRPKSGSMLLYSRKKVRYRRDGYCWKKRKDGKTTREDHMKLKVQGTECIYGCYVHSAILPTFHRRCYWLLQNPDIVLVHYLNVPYPDDNKMAVITPSLSLWGDKKEWTKEELVSQLKPMFFSEDEPDANNEIEISTAETVEAIVGQLMEKQRLARQAALVKQLECGCPDSTCADGKSCSHPMRRITAAKTTDKRTENNNQVSSTTPNVLIGQRIYPRWLERRGREHITELSHPASVSTPKPIDNSIHFQVIPTSSHSNISNQISNRTNNNSNNSNTNNNSNQPTNSQLTNQSNQLNRINTNSMIINSNNNNNNNNSNSNNSNISNNNQLTAVVSHSNQINLTGAINTRDNSIIQNNDNHNMSMSSSTNQNHHHIIDNNTTVNARSSNNNNNQTRLTVNTNVSNASIVTSAPPLVLSLSQIQGHGGLLILNGQQQSYVCHSQQQQQHQIHQQQQQQQHQIQQRRNNNKDDNKLNSQQPSHILTTTTNNVVPKQEAMDSSSSSSDKQLDSVNIYDSMSYTSTQQNTPIDSPLKENNNGAKDFHDSLQFFNETLDLSQEDIQKTLSANMPIGSHTSDDQISGDINPMDFIDNCDVGDAPGGHVDDDVFVNLDAFDMLVEFPELELDGKNGFLQTTETDLKKSVVNLTNSDNHQEVFNITDYSPEWAYPEGGVKVLVTGPWNANSSYTVLFDSFPVPTTIVQSGVLRCYCPAHEVGLATLQVACDSFVISDSVIFEYKSPPKTESTSDGNTNDALFKFSLLDRFETINDRLQIKTEPGEIPEESALFSQPNFEDRLVTFCQSLTSKTWRNATSNSWSSGHKGMTLLHFASALGYSKLVCAMLAWRSENSSPILEAEVDALSQDVEGCTPLMWACTRGHTDTALVLCRWNCNALNVKNNHQQGPLEIAKKNGYSSLISEIERFEIQKQMDSDNMPPLTSITINSSQQLMGNFNQYSNIFTYDSTNYFNNSINNKNVSSVFSTVSPTLTSPLININLNNKNTQNILDTINNIQAQQQQQHQQQQSSQSHCSSPASIGSATSLNSNRSHDGVFLRPGAVSSVQSPPGARFSKRPSVDSGINMDIRPTVTRSSGKGIREQQKLSRFDRSMSLPISNSPLSYNSIDNADSYSLSIDSSMEGSSTTSSSINTNCLSSPLRKMDFALCEVSGGDSSPIGNQQSTSDDDDERHPEGENIIQEGGVVGESDAKVLTLAEQIIAAMPERIKNESEEMMSLGSPIPEALSADTPVIGGLNDSFMEPLLDSMSNSHFDQEFNFEFSDHNYRYHDVGTPCSSLSPASSGPLQSPASYSIPQDPPMGSPSPPPTTQDFTEFLHASNSTPKPFEADFSNLTLTDREQRELYEAAKCIQKAYRSYKGRKKMEEQDKERTAAIVIQNYYRRYKQYAYYRQMTHAALVIQNGYRSYCENKRFKKSQHQNVMSGSGTNLNETSTQFQTYYKNFQNEQQMQCSSGTTSKEPSPSGPLKRTYSQRTQNQAARKIQQFMRQSKLKLQRERAEKERLAHQRRAEYLQSLQFPVHQGIPSRDQNENRTPQESAKISTELHFWSKIM